MSPSPTTDHSSLSRSAEGATVNDEHPTRHPRARIKLRGPLCLFHQGLGLSGALEKEANLNRRSSRCGISCCGGKVALAQLQLTFFHLRSYVKLLVNLIIPLSASNFKGDKPVECGLPTYSCNLSLVPTSTLSSKGERQVLRKEVQGTSVSETH